MIGFEEFQGAVLQFLRSRNESPTLTVGVDDNLFDSGLIDSFDLPHLIVHLEAVLQKRIEIGEGGLESFYTVRRSYELFARPNEGDG